MFCCLIFRFSFFFFLIFSLFFFFFFFFQAEDGIRDGRVTGVQTCALPIYPCEADGLAWVSDGDDVYHVAWDGAPGYLARDRSEERRVGKECRSRWSPYH